MELKDFIKKVLIDLDRAIDEARLQTNREISLPYSTGGDNKNVEFDIAVTVEDEKDVSGKAGVKVLSFVEAGGSGAMKFKNSTVSRVKFSLQIDPNTKKEASQLSPSDFFN